MSYSNSWQSFEVHCSKEDLHTILVIHAHPFPNCRGYTAEYIARRYPPGWEYNKLKYGRYTIVESDLFEWRIDMTSGTLVHEGWSGDGHSEFGHAVEAEHLPELLNASKMKDLAELMKGLENGLEIKSAWLSISRIPYSSFRCP